MEADILELITVKMVRNWVEEKVAGQAGTVDSLRSFPHFFWSWRDNESHSSLSNIPVKGLQTRR